MRQVCTIVYYFCCLERGLFWLAPSPQNLNLWPEIMTACCYICIDVRGIVAKFCRTRLYSNKVTHLDLSVFFASLLGYQRQVERLNFLFCCFHFHVENKNKKQEVANCCELIVIKSQYLCAMLPTLYLKLGKVVLLELCKAYYFDIYKSELIHSVDTFQRWGASWCWCSGLHACVYPLKPQEVISGSF